MRVLRITYLGRGKRHLPGGVFHRSIVFHFPNLPRIACATLELLVPGNATLPAASATSALPPGGASQTGLAPKETHSVEPFLGAAVAHGVHVLGLAAALAAMLAALPA